MPLTAFNVASLQGNDLSLYKEIVEIRRASNGPRHPKTLNALSLVAQLMQDHGELEEAEPLAREAEASWRAVLGPFHEDTLVATSNLAQLLTARGKYDEAEPIARRAVDVAKSVMGKDARDTLVALSNLAQTLAAQGKFEEAEPLMRQDLAKSLSLLVSRGASRGGTLSLTSSVR